MTVAYVYHLRHVIYFVAAAAVLAVAVYHWRGERALSSRSPALEDLRRMADELAEVIGR